MTAHDLQAELDSIFYDQECRVFTTSMEPITDEAGMAGPIVVGVFRVWLLKKLRELGCEQKAVIKEAAVRAIIAGVPNPFLQTLLIEVLSTAIDAMCPVD